MTSPLQELLQAAKQVTSPKLRFWMSQLEPLGESLRAQIFGGTSGSLEVFILVILLDGFSKRLILFWVVSSSRDARTFCTCCPRSCAASPPPMLAL